MDKDTVLLVRRIGGWPGWVVKERARGWQVHPPSGRTVITIHRTPSDRRTYRNVVAQLRRAGAPI